MGHQLSPATPSIQLACIAGRLQTSPKNGGEQNADVLLVAPYALFCISVTEVTKDFTVLQCKDYIDGVKGFKLLAILCLSNQTKTYVQMYAALVRSNDIGSHMTNRSFISPCPACME